MRSVHFAIICFLFITVSCTGLKEEQEVYFEKTVDFSSEATMEEKLNIASRIVPTAKQLAWQEMEMTAFVHFTVNTFTDMEWGHGDESPEIFNPTDFDARQWAKIVSETGMKMIIVTCKHHDGFCLWPTETTSHSVASSPWKKGEGDIVREVKDACDEYGLKFGVYLSPWDRNAASYGNSPEYNTFFMAQLRELLTNYGKIDEVWFDGACGEGPNGKKQVYDWDAYYALIKELQPNAVTAIMGEDIRWVGTESGYGRETEWSVTAMAPGGSEAHIAINERLGIGAMSEDLGSEAIIAKADRLFWYPAEVDVSIRPGWFYHKSEDNRVKSLAKMVDIYFSSVGRNAVLLLNIPPDKRGLIHENDERRLKEFKDYIDRAFSENIAFRAFTKYKGARQSVDGSKETYTIVDEFPASIEYSFPFATDFNVFMIQEFIQKGQRIEEFSLEAMVDGQWVELATSTTVGYKKLLRFDRVNAENIRLTINKSRAEALISEIGVYNAPDILTDPVITRDKSGLVTISTELPGPVICYTIDGSEPTAESTIYTQPFGLAAGATVKARSFINDFENEGNVISEEFDIAPTEWSIIEYSDQLVEYPASFAIDGNTSTMWHTAWSGDIVPHPHSVTVDMGMTHILKGFTYSPRTDPNKSGTVVSYNYYTSLNGRDWSRTVPNGHFSNIKNNPVKQYVRFPEEVTARYFRFETLSSIDNSDWVSVGELGVITR